MYTEHSYYKFMLLILWMNTDFVVYTGFKHVASTPTGYGLLPKLFFLFICMLDIVS